MGLRPRVRGSAPTDISPPWPPVRQRARPWAVAPPRAPTARPRPGRGPLVRAARAGGLGFQRRPRTGAVCELDRPLLQRDHVMASGRGRAARVSDHAYPPHIPRVTSSGLGQGGRGGGEGAFGGRGHGGGPCRAVDGSRGKRTGGGVSDRGLGPEGITGRVPRPADHDGRRGSRCLSRGIRDPPSAGLARGGPGLRSPASPGPLNSFLGALAASLPSRGVRKHSPVDMRPAYAPAHIRRPVCACAANGCASGQIAPKGCAAKGCAAVGVCDRQWPEVSDFVARFCTWRESEKTRTCENCTRNACATGSCAAGSVQVTR